MTASPPRVLIIGCGFGGLAVVRALSKVHVEITLIDRTNHHLFQPLLYQVATAGLSAPAISAPIRHTLRHKMQRGNLTILQAEVTGIAIVDLAVPPLGSLRFSGLPAWLLWLFAHLYFLIGFRNRLIVMVEWAWAYFTFERSARVVAEPARPSDT